MSKLFKLKKTTFLFNLTQNSNGSSSNKRGILGTPGFNNLTIQVTASLDVLA